MRKKLLSGKIMVVLAVLLVLFMTVGVAEADRVDASGQWKYVLKDGGAMITGYVEELEGDLVIPGDLDGYVVTGIGERTLDYLPLTSVTIPDSIVEILPYSFSYCRTLERIEVAPGNPAFESIDGVLFDKRQGMLVAYPYGRASETYAIPAGTRIIGKNAFCFRERLTGITIPDSVTRIDQNAFRACVSLTGGIIIPGSVASIGESAFEGCSGLADIVLMEGITEIGGFAFTHCSGIAAISIPSSVGSIGYGAFIGCDRLTSLTLPASVTSIGNDAFADCPNLTLTVAEGSYAEQYAQENGTPYIVAQALGNQPDDNMSLAISPTGTADDLLIKQIDEFFTLPKAEIIEKLGPDYTVVPAGPEGACDGYYYEDLGMAFAFYPDSDTLELIDCYPNFKIHGVGQGSLFSEILEALGDTEIVETWLELPIYTAFMVRYRLGNADYSFIAFEKDEPVRILWIHQTP